ncbi:MAG TPA: ribosome silencing factor [Isosphaeraceae bacterium]|nr:ribosome silencing factor [Isosphaeraceae bacterium]
MLASVPLDVEMAKIKKPMTTSPSPATPEVSPDPSPPRMHATQDELPSTAVSRRAPGRVDTALERARICARLGDENRGRDILLLDLRATTPLVDFFVIISAASRRQSSAIASEIDQEMKRLDERKLGIEGSEEGRWTLIDYGDFVVHVFSDEARAYYALEEIWGDASRLDWQDPSRVRPPSHAERDMIEGQKGQ